MVYAQIPVHGDPHNHHRSTGNVSNHGDGDQRGSGVSLERVDQICVARDEDAEDTEAEKRQANEDVSQWA